MAQIVLMSMSMLAGKHAAFKMTLEEEGEPKRVADSGKIVGKSAVVSLSEVSEEALPMALRERTDVLHKKGVLKSALKKPDDGAPATGAAPVDSANKAPSAPKSIQTKLKEDMTVDLDDEQWICGFGQLGLY